MIANITIAEVNLFIGGVEYDTNGGGYVFFTLRCRACDREFIIVSAFLSTNYPLFIPDRGILQKRSTSSGSFGAALQIQTSSDSAYRQLIILFSLIQNKNGVFRNAVAFRSKQFRQLTIRAPGRSKPRFAQTPFRVCAARNASFRRPFFRTRYSSEKLLSSKNFVMHFVMRPTLGRSASAFAKPPPNGR